MSIIQELENIRSEVLMTDTHLKELIRRLENNSGIIEARTSENFETVYSININPVIFKGKKPTAVIFGDERMDARNWKTVVELIMKRCNKDTEKHVSLMNLRDKIFGRDRVLLSKENDGMHSPLKIDENLYVETHYDAESLMRILLARILDAVDYDYSNISVSTRNANLRRG